MAQSDVSSLTVADILGHSSVKTTAKYYHGDAKARGLATASREGDMTFHDKLVSELNDKHGHLELRWHNSSYANDACGSAMFEIDNMKETYIQLHAFETPEEAREEGLEQFSITISFFGDIDYAAYVGDDRDVQGGHCRR